MEKCPMCGENWILIPTIEGWCDQCDELID